MYLIAIIFNIYTAEELVVQPFVGGKSQPWDIREDGTIAEEEFDNVVTIRNDLLVPGTACHVAAFEGFSGQRWSLTYL